MNSRGLHLAILRCAAWLVPREQRAEWSAEWTSELWYVNPDRQTSFCLGAIPDALWFRRNSPLSLRLESPLQCLLLLTLLAGAALLIASRLHALPRAAFARNLVIVSPARHRGSPVRLDQYRSWNNREQRVFTDLAFYHLVQQPGLRVALASDNLFRLLNIPVATRGSATLVLTHAAWRDFFGADPRIVGRSLEIAGRHASIGAVLPTALNLPGGIDGWLLDDLSRLPPHSEGFVLARLRDSSTQRMSVPNDSGGRDNFDCFPLGGRPDRLFAAFLFTVILSALLLPATTSLSLGDYPGRSGIRRWSFLAAKIILILVMVYCGLCYVAASGSDPGIVLGAILGLRWAIVDQRRRCPVCLRLLTHPVRFGQASRTFLDWYGTEFICARGHGLLHVPEIPTSCYDTQRWLSMAG